MRTISQVTVGKNQYMELLLIGDEQEDMILRYLDRGEMFVCEEKESVLGVCVVTDEGGGVCELKNISVYPEYQRQGVGRALVEAVTAHYSCRFDRMIVGTGESPLTVPFYESCGFVFSHRKPGFFIENYDHPIYEAGVRLVDMVCFEKKLLEE